MPATTPVCSTFGPFNSTRMMDCFGPRKFGMTPSTTRSNFSTWSPANTVYAYPCMPGCTCESGKISLDSGGAPATGTAHANAANRRKYASRGRSRPIIWRKFPRTLKACQRFLLRKLSASAHDARANDTGRPFGTQFNPLRSRPSYRRLDVLELYAVANELRCVGLWAG